MLYNKQLLQKRCQDRVCVVAKLSNYACIVRKRLLSDSFWIPLSPKPVVRTCFPNRVINCATTTFTRKICRLRFRGFPLIFYSPLLNLLDDHGEAEEVLLPRCQRL